MDSVNDFISNYKTELHNLNDLYLSSSNTRLPFVKKLISDYITEITKNIPGMIDMLDIQVRKINSFLEQNTSSILVKMIRDISLLKTSIKSISWNDFIETKKTRISKDDKLIVQEKCAMIDKILNLVEIAEQDALEKDKASSLYTILKSSNIYLIKRELEIIQKSNPLLNVQIKKCLNNIERINSKMFLVLIKLNKILHN